MKFKELLKKFKQKFKENAPDWLRGNLKIH